MSNGLALDGAVDSFLCTLMEKGPNEELGWTVNAQPAVLSVSMALWERSELKEPAAVMGHSLGEYTALVAAGSIPPHEAMDLVKNRARFMDASHPEGMGGMAAVIGMSWQDVEDVIAGIGDLWVANLNGGSQIVISGSTRSIDVAAPLLKEGGARRVVPLKVSVASHCPYMDNATKSLQAYLGTIEIKAPLCPLIANVSALPETDPSRIKELLGEQLVKPVRFEESVLSAAGLGIDRFIEIGPRSVLAPLVKRIVPDAKVEVITNDEH